MERRTDENLNKKKKKNRENRTVTQRIFPSHTTIFAAAVVDGILIRAQKPSPPFLFYFFFGARKEIKLYIVRV